MEPEAIGKFEALLQGLLLVGPHEKPPHVPHAFANTASSDRSGHWPLPGRSGYSDISRLFLFFTFSTYAAFCDGQGGKRPWPFRTRLIGSLKGDASHPLFQVYTPEHTNITTSDDVFDMSAVKFQGRPKFLAMKIEAIMPRPCFCENFLVEDPL
jgi:hypothetical protein